MFFYIPHINSDDDGISQFVVNFKVNKKLQKDAPGDYNGEVNEAEDGRWVYKNTKVTLNNNDVINYRLSVQVFEEQYDTENNLRHTVKSIKIQLFSCCFQLIL